MRPLDELRFIAARVQAEVRAHPSPGPLLGEPEAPELVPYGPCRYGHRGLAPRRAGRQRCLECDRERWHRRKPRP